MPDQPGVARLAVRPGAAPLLAAVAAGEVRFGPRADADEVRRFEERHGVALPDEYRRMILELGDGGDGPPYYGVEPLSARRVEHGVPDPDDGPAPLAERFPGVPRTDFEELSAEEGDRAWAEFEKGRLLLGTDGCAILFVLVLTGSARGQVWQIDEFGARPEAEDVLAWYAAWLERGGVREHPELDRPVPVALRDADATSPGRSGSTARRLLRVAALLPALGRRAGR